MTRWIGQWSLLSGPVPVVVVVVRVFAGAWLVLRRDPHHLTRTAPPRQGTTRQGTHGYDRGRGDDR